MSNKLVWDKIKSSSNFSEIHLPTFLVIAFDVILMVIAWQISFLSFPYFILSIALLAISLLHFYLLLHEAAHSALFNSSFLNDVFGHFYGWSILMPFLPRQTSHLLHHTWTGHPRRDPANNRMIQKFSVITEAEAKKLEFVWKYWLPAIIVNDRIGLWRAPFQQKKNGLKSRRVKQEITWAYIYSFCYIAFYSALFYFGYLQHFLLLYIPTILIVFLIEELANLPHHAETPLLNPDDKALPYWEQHKVTHSCKTVPVWSQFILLNFNLHTAHHWFPAAPWYSLPELNKMMQESAPHVIENETKNELEWSLKNRKRPLLNIMGHYFDKVTVKAPN